MAIEHGVGGIFGVDDGGNRLNVGGGVMSRAGYGRSEGLAKISGLVVDESGDVYSPGPW